MNRVTHEVRPLGCARLRCSSCLPRLAWRRGLAQAHARPQRFCTFTRVGNDWPTVRGRMKRLRHAVAAAGFGWEWVWQVERNPAGTGHHVHCWQRGDYVPQAALSRMAVTEGMGPVVDIRRWRSNESRATAYALKAITYTFKNAGGVVDATAFLTMNGWRLSHQSRGWWTAGGARDQEREAIRDLLGDTADEWVVVEAGDQGRWLEVNGVRHAGWSGGRWEAIPSIP